MNLFSGGFISGNKLVLEDSLIPLPAFLFSRVENHQPVTLGIRQEAISLSAEATPSNGFQLPAEVETYEADYVHRMQTVHLHSGHWRFSALSSLEMNFRIGQSVYAQLDVERFYLFDTRSGLRI